MKRPYLWASLLILGGIWLWLRRELRDIPVDLDFTEIL